MFSFNLVLPDAVRPVGEEARGARQNLAWASLHLCEWQSSQLFFIHFFFVSSSHTSVSRGFRQRNSSVGGSGVGKAEGILGSTGALSPVGGWNSAWFCLVDAISKLTVRGKGTGLHLSSNSLIIDEVSSSALILFFFLLFSWDALAIVRCRTDNLRRSYRAQFQL